MNGLPFLPALFCLKMADPLLLTLIAMTIKTNTGQRIINASRDMIISRPRFKILEKLIKNSVLGYVINVNLMVIGLDTPKGTR